ncbi:hypothetical protein [Tuwongella immobilis]|uniref:Uncharacterized protein n=1 Tax=Tuwongella immobilis TaxID=692036 RepID=A0A6C2YVJ8_9BACT|nr:hypothetical protein [Tuwongella immobilis]VIP05526.1 unnamed protein product [Tuwongella immobilis]VTS08408.1 unnamed protein product [Tuwongella immobilis]
MKMIDLMVAVLPGPAMANCGATCGATCTCSPACSHLPKAGNDTAKPVVSSDDLDALLAAVESISA